MALAPIAGPLVMPDLAAAAEAEAAKAAPAGTGTPGAPAPNMTPPTLEELMRDPTLVDTALSPDGTRYALLTKYPQGDQVHAAVLLSAGPDKPPRRVPLGPFDVYQVEWANDERLLFWIKFTHDERGRKLGADFGDYFLALPVLRIASIDATGGDMVVLFGNQKAALARDFNLANVVDFMSDDPRNILMQMWDYPGSCWALHRVDVYTGVATLLEKGVPATDGWFTQKGVPVLRWDSNSRGTVVTVMTRAPGEKDWKLFRKFRRNELKKLDDFEVVGATPDAGVILVASRAEGEDTVRLRRFDVRTMEFGEVAAAKDGFDVTDAYTDENGVLVGASYIEYRTGYVFADPAFNAHFKGLNTFFGGECNVGLYDVSLDHNRYLLKITGPRQPGAFYVYDKARHDLEPLGLQRPWLNYERLARMEALRVSTRDGGMITAYLSTPPGLKDGPQPLLVMPHGGPHGIRDSMTFDVFVQAMAARGWLVLQPNFRGSGGYGRAFEDQGRRHWADRMQEDVEDAVAQVIASGRADPKRVAIWGWSYGGYCALMQAVRRPDLYKAAVSIAGDADMFELLNFSRREDGADSPSYAFWQATVGDPKADQELLRKASPSLRAAEIAAPVLLAHGTRDDTVSPRQSKIMAKALKEAGKRYEYLEFKGEGHGDWSDENLKDIITRSADFIARYI